MKNRHHLHKIAGIALLFLFLGICSDALAQRNRRTNRVVRERSPQQELQYDNINYLTGIRSVRFHPEGNESGLPVWFLGEQEQLVLSFDDLRGISAIFITASNIAPLTGRAAVCPHWNI